LAANFVHLVFNFLFEIAHIFKGFVFSVDKLCVLFVTVDLNELNLNGPPSDDSFAFGKKLFANYAFQQ
jgi:hypothetical protein